MTHEFKEIVLKAIVNKNKGLKNCLATVVALDGSSYRKPGVRMLLSSDLKMVGAISGGCVEKEVLLQAQSVFETGIPKVMSYNGRYRLGCEGTLYVLIEVFDPSEDFFDQFFACINNRKPFTIGSFYTKKEVSSNGLGSYLNKTALSFNKNAKIKNDFELFKQELKACFKLVIIGAEHDSVELCQLASNLGWEVTIVCSIKDPKELSSFKGATTIKPESPETIDLDDLDSETALVIMTHNYSLDLRYLMKLKNKNLPFYIGVLGSYKRGKQLMNDCADTDMDFFEDVHERLFSPAGLAIGAETPQEIGISILSEILAIKNNKPQNSLKD